MDLLVNQSTRSTWSHLTISAVKATASAHTTTTRTATDSFDVIHCSVDVGRTHIVHYKHLSSTPLTSFDKGFISYHPEFRVYVVLNIRCIDSHLKAILPLLLKMNSEQAEAGPSAPRTPPGTPPAKPRRRSWFGLVTSPFTSNAPASNSATSPRRKSFEDDETGHELTERPSKSSLVDPPHIPAGRLGSIRRSKGKEPETEPGEEILTIDGQVDSPSSVRSRRKKKWKSTGLDEEQGETVRLDDLSLRRGGSRSTLRSSSDAVRDTADFPNQAKVSYNQSECVMLLLTSIGQRPHPYRRRWGRRTRTTGSHVQYSPTRTRSSRSTSTPCSLST